MRITDRIRYLRPLEHIHLLQKRMNDLQNEIASGRRIHHPSDDPGDSAVAVKLHGDLARIADFRSSIERADHLLSETERALNGAVEVFTSVRERTIQGSNDVLNASDRHSLAVEVEHALISLRDLANTRYDDTYIFSGRLHDQPAFDAAGVYQGDSHEILLDVEEAHRVAVNIPGDEAFQNNVDAFQAVQDVIDGLRTDDGPAIRAAITNLDQAMSDLIDARTRIANRLVSMDHLVERLEIRDMDIHDHLATVESADLVESISEFSLKEHALTGALAAASRMVQPSLLDFLR